MGETIKMAMAKSTDFAKTRGGRAPKFLVVDPATYRALDYEYRTLMPHRPPRLERIMGMAIVVVPVPKMMHVSGDPWEDSDRYDPSSLMEWRADAEPPR